MARALLVSSTRRIYNQIRCGMPVDVVFYDKENQYVNQMRVLSFDKAPSDTIDTGNVIEVFLISSIYFDNVKETAVHDGAVGTIIENIMRNSFKGSNYTFSGTSTDDMPRRRYQTSEKTLDFMNRILKYGIKGNYPVYLYHNAKGEINLRGISDLIGTSPKCFAYSLYSERMGDFSLSEMTEKPVQMFGFHNKYNGKSAVSSIENIFSTRNFRYMEGNIDSYNFSGAGDLSNQVEKSLPPKTVFYGWNLAPTDALTIAAKETFEKTCEACQFEASFSGFDIDNIELGSTINVFLPYDNSAKNKEGRSTNLGNGRYLITSVSYYYDNEIFNTSAHMIQTAC